MSRPADTYRGARRNLWRGLKRIVQSQGEPDQTFAEFNGAQEHVTQSPYFGPVNVTRAIRMSVAKWHQRRAQDTARKEAEKAARIEAERKAQSMLARAA